jgi:hypothetical protein
MVFIEYDRTTRFRIKNKVTNKRIVKFQSHFQCEGGS